MKKKLTTEERYELDRKKLEAGYLSQQYKNPSEFVKNVAAAMAYQYQLVREYKEIMIEMADRNNP